MYESTKFQLGSFSDRIHALYRDQYEQGKAPLLFVRIVLAVIYTAGCFRLVVDSFKDKVLEIDPVQFFLTLIAIALAESLFISALIAMGKGASPGMKPVGLKVISRSGEDASFFQLAVRNVIPFFVVIFVSTIFAFLCYFLRGSGVGFTEDLMLSYKNQEPDYFLASLCGIPFTLLITAIPSVIGQKYLLLSDFVSGTYTIKN